MSISKFTLLVLVVVPAITFCQTLIFSEPAKKASSISGLEVIGKVENNFLVCNLVTGKYELEIYNSQLELKKVVDMGFIPSETNKVNFITYPHALLVIFQCKIKDSAFSKMAVLDKNAQLLKIITIDSGRSHSAKGLDLYDVTSSGNKKYILFTRLLSGIIKDKLQIEQIIVDEEISILNREKYFIPYALPDQAINELIIDDERNIVFLTYPQEFNSTNKITLYKLPANSDELITKELSINKFVLRNPKIEINNKTHLYSLTSLYQNEQKNVDGLIAVIYKPDFSEYSKAFIYQFRDSLKTIAGSISTHETTFNNYFLKDVLYKADGSYLVTVVMGEDQIKISPDIYNNRADAQNLELPYFQMPNIYSEDGKRILQYGDQMGYLFLQPPSFNRETVIRNTLKSARGNMIVFSMDKYNHLSNIKSLSKAPELTPFIPYYQAMNSKNQFFFLFNNGNLLKSLLTSVTLDDSYNLVVNYVNKSINKGYTFLPELGKQVDGNSMLMPWINNKRLGYALLQFQ